MSRFVMTLLTATVALTWAFILPVSSLVAQETVTSDTTPFPLAEALERVHLVAPQRRAAQAYAQAAAGTLHQADRPPNPSLELQQENLGAGSPIDQTIDLFATITQPVEIGGKRAARTAVAAAEVKVAQASVRQIERKLAQETVHLYLASLQAHLFSEFLANNYAELQTLVQVMTKRVSEGYAAEADLMKFRAEVARLETQMMRVRLDFNSATMALSALLDLPTPLSGARLVMPPQLAPPTDVPAEFAEQAATRQPELLAAQAKLDRARHSLDLEKAKRLPDPSFTAGYKRTGGADTLVAGVSVPLPVFDRNAGNIERALAEEHAAALELTAARQRQHAATLSVLQAARELAKRASVINQQLLQPAEVTRNAARVSFHEGATNILHVIDAERVYTEARREALELTLEAYEKAFEAHLLVAEEGHL